MKKRLISLLVALCMAVTLLPVSAITAWAEGGGSTLKPLQFKRGLPVTDGIRPTTDSNEHTIYTGDGWSYDDTAKVLTIAPENPTTYDLKAACLTQNSIACSIIIKEKATITDGSFINNITNYGTITGGVFKPLSSKSLTFENSGIITGGEFLSALGSLNFTNSISGTIEGGIFSVSSLSNSGAINGGVFSRRPNGGKVAAGYTLNVESPDSTTEAGIEYFKDSRYIIPHSSYTTSITVLYYNPRGLQPFPIDVTIDNTQQMLLTEWAGKVESSSDPEVLYVTFTAPPADADTVTLSILTRLVIDKAGYPVGTEGGTQDYSGNGWKFEKGNSTLTLESGSYDFSGEKNALHPLNPAVQLKVKSGATLTGGAAGDGSGVTWQLTENTDDPSTYKLTISGSGAMEDFPFGSYQPWYSFHDQITSVVVSPGVTSIGQCAFSRFAKLTHVDIADSVISIGWDAFYYCSSLTNITIPQSVTYIGPLAFFHCTNLSSITLSNNITSIGSSAFEDCTNLTSITIPGSVTSIGLAAFCNCTKLTSITIPDSVTTIDLEAFKNCSSLTSITIPGSVTSIGPYVFDGCTSLNDIRYSGTSESVISALSGYVPTLVTFDYGDKVPEAERMIKVFVKTGGTLTAPTTLPNVVGYEFKGWLTEDGELYDFPGAPTGQLTLYANWEKIPDPKPEPKPEPEPEAPTYTLTVKGGTFTYNGGEAMTSASVPVDAEVKVTLNQSAVPEGMVFDLWAMDEASLLGNPAVAYNEESFTIPAGSVAKGSTVTVEAQYRDATIESEPSILGTAAIIGVAGAGTAVIVWQGYRIGMELYEKYFQPTPEETAAEQPAPEAPAAAAAS